MTAKFVTGFGFPMRFDADGDYEKAEDEALVDQNLQMIVHTREGTITQTEDAGSKAHESVFEQNDDVLRAQLEADIREAITDQEPNVDIQNQQFSITSEEEFVEVVVPFKIISVQKDTSAVFILPRG